MEFDFKKKEYVKLSIFQTQLAIKIIKDTFQGYLEHQLKLNRVSAPLFVTKDSGLNDDLTGVERKVEFDIKSDKKCLQVVQSLAKWKREALKKYDIKIGHGIYTDMDAIRRDEDLDAIHSIYVDQWDWEKVIIKKERTLEYLKTTVRKIADCIFKTIADVKKQFPKLKVDFKKDVYFITLQELCDLYPTLTPKQREKEICKKYGTVFIIGIGYPLKNGDASEKRAPDYDDWNLNGDLLVYFPTLDIGLELSSMGIRVDKKSLIAQLTFKEQMEKLKFGYHKSIAEGKLPLSIGGGIGQSRLCMYILSKGHIGEVQSSYWDKATLQKSKITGLQIL